MITQDWLLTTEKITLEQKLKNKEEVRFIRITIMYTELEKINSHASHNRFLKVGRRIDLRLIYACLHVCVPGGRGLNRTRLKITPIKEEKISSLTHV